MRHWFRFALAFALLHATLAFAGPAPEDSAAAEALFREGKRLMGEGRFAEACPKLEESYRLDPGGGTLINLASCHESEGKTATAWAEFSEALAMARRDGRAEREELARTRIAALEPKLARVVIALAPGADHPGLEVRRRGTHVKSATLGVPIPLDPGTYPVTASAPGRTPWEGSVTAVAGQVTRLVIPALAAAPKPAAPSRLAPAPPRPAPTPPVTLPPAPVTSPPATQAAAPSGTNHRLIWGLVSGGVALACFGTSGYFAAHAKQKLDDSKKYCSDGVCSSQTGINLNHDAKQALVYGNVMLGIGIAVSAASLYLLLTSRSWKRAEKKAPTVSASVSPGGAGLVLGGVW